VMEDLNFGFKRGRFHVEKQVYQKLEKMLIDKLNYLVVKTIDKNNPGGLMKALQLTSKFDSFQKMGKQMGFMYYVPAWNTSKIDPATGFVDFLRPRYQNLEKSQEFFCRFKSICFNNAKEQFEFTFDYSDFTNRAEGGRTAWTVCANNQVRYFYNKSLNQNRGGHEAIKVCEAMEDLLGSVGIDYAHGGNIMDQIAGQHQADFFKRLIKLLSITLSLRHNNGLKGEDEQDFILSPVADNKGKFFCSLSATDSEPKDADANGAYHIALKGLWILQQLGRTIDLNKPNLSISNKEWLQFAQQKKFLE
jgi:CRISPR-associated protein Cpf1